ncbi:hypothetical protein FCI23_43805 [Actinacidiphila oryziradicis]|uniref:Uncharacterized protein n=1 Tax=Actinacidiphila oryziradicis TaxID=2571141 RepID=A0A4U0RWK7_9ACTN|nr:hypothetical protein FCI23_43805 [Actinacidiphila oryziradicis]
MPARWPETIRAGAEAKNNPADLINIALEKLVEAGHALPHPDATSRYHAQRRCAERVTASAGSISLCPLDVAFGLSLAEPPLDTRQSSTIFTTTNLYNK